MKELFTNIDLFEKICDNFYIYEILKMKGICKLTRDNIMKMERIINFINIIKVKLDLDSIEFFAQFIQDKLASNGI